MKSVNHSLPTAANSQSNTGRGVLPWAMGTLITIVVLTLIVVIFGSVSGEEFNPWTFRRQRYRFMQIPILRKQVLPTKYNDVTSSMEIAIATIIGAPPIPAFTVEGGDEEEEEVGESETATTGADSETEKGRWHLVESRRAATELWAGDAKILCDSLDIRDHNRGFYWENWTTEHPAAAKVLWPIIARTAQAQLYVLIPDLLDIATNHTDVNQMTSDLNRVVENDSLKLAAAMLAGDKPSRALQAYELVLDYEPNSKTAASGLVAATAAIDAAKNADAGNKDGETKTPAAEVDSEFPSESSNGDE